MCRVLQSLLYKQLQVCKRRISWCRQQSTRSSPKLNEWIKVWVFPDFPWIDSISINGFILWEKVKEELKWIQLPGNALSSLFRSNFNPPPEFRDDTCMAYLHRDDCCVYAASVLDIWSFYIRFWKFSVYLEFAAWYLRKFFTVKPY